MLVITGEGLKTLDAVRGTFEATEIEPSYEAFDCCSRGDGVVMAVTVKIPTQLRANTGGAGEVPVDGENVGAVLEALCAEHPELRERLFDDGGELRRFVNVYADGEDVRFGDGLQTAVQREVQILPAVAGG